MENINSISPQIRDSLLSKNLVFANSITQNYIEQFGKGLGRQISIGDSAASVIDQPLLEDIAVGFREYQFSKNKFIPNGDINNLISTTYNPNFTEQVEGGYIQDGKIYDTDDVTVMNGIVNILSGDSYFGYGTSLESKILQGVTKKRDTKMIEIGTEELVKEFKFRTIANIGKETVGRLNLSLSSLLSGGKFFKDDFKITTSTTFFGRLGDKALDVLGVQNPHAELSDDASLFTSDLPTSLIGGVSMYDSNLIAEAMLRNTGLGQRKAFYEQFKLTLDPKYNRGGNRYAPIYAFDDTKDGENSSVVYAKYDFETGENIGHFEEHTEGVIEPYSRDNKTLFSWEVWDERSTVNNPYFSSKPDWEGKERVTNEARDRKTYSDKKTLLGKTQELFNSGKIKTILSNKGMMIDKHELVSGEDQNGSGYYMISKGSQVMYADVATGAISDNPNEVFCRSWINSHRYDKVHNLQKHRGLDKEGGHRENIDKSVLDSNGFVKIAPYKVDSGDNSFNDPNYLKRYMFSIENLAWAKDLDTLPDIEIGNGDPLTGTKGRIMWFPPYDLQFSENTGVNLDTHTFIGRGEPLYTYNSTERSGNLSFKIIMDHPMWVNNPELLEEYGKSGMFDDFFNAITAGCGALPEYYGGMLSRDERNAIDAELNNEPVVVEIPVETPPEPFNIYFPNDVASLGDLDSFSLSSFDNDLEVYTNNVPSSYETKIGRYAYTLYESNTPDRAPTVWGEIQNEAYTPGWHASQRKPYPDRQNFGLNKGWKNQTFLTELADKLINECPSCKIKISGYASVDGQKNSNQKLSDARANSIQKLFKKVILPNDTVSDAIRYGGGDLVVGKGETGTQNNKPVDDQSKKRARVVTVSFEYDPNITNELNRQAEEAAAIRQNKLLTARMISRFMNEAEHFKKLKNDDPFTYNRISEKIKFFQPAYHSITPEGFNSRLTFLNQCTRQGSTTNDSTRPNNMVFGAPPVCILRVGDFYNTKIMIDSMSIDYEGLWDLNPEGVGVQPMIANVSLTFKFIGGSSMGGAINRLQNAVSFNYYANTEIYDPRAFTIVNSDDAGDINSNVYKQPIKSFNIEKIMNGNNSDSLSENDKNNE